MHALRWITVALALVLGLTATSASTFPAPGYPKDIGHVTVNLDLPPEQRWYPVIVGLVTKYGYDSTLGRVVAYFDKTIPKAVRPLMDEVAALLAPHLSDEYIAEIRGIYSAVQNLGHGSQLDFDTLVTLNIFYSLSSGCTSIVAQDPQGLVWHARNMDWNFDGLSLYNITAIVDFQRDGKLSFQTLTWIGFIGGLTGVRPNSFSVTIDQRENGPVLDVLLNIKRLATDGIAPVVFLARDVLSTEGITYADAVTQLSTRKIAAPVYYIVAGVNPNEGAIITRDWNGTDPHGVLSIPHGPQPWYVLETNYDFWKPAPPRDDRRAVGQAAMNAMGQQNVNEANLFQVMQTRGNTTTRGTFNSDTIYTVVINPKLGSFRGWGWQ